MSQVLEAPAKHAPLDLNTQGKLAAFSLARLCLMTVVLLTTIFLRQEVLGESVVLRIYAALCASFGFSLLNVSLWDQTLRVRLYIPSQLLYDLLLTSYLVYLTGVNDSIFLFLYLLNIVFASVVYQLNGALLVSALSGSIYAFIYYANIDDGMVNGTFYNLAYNVLLFLLTALLCGQLMDELKRQKTMLESQRLSIAHLELLNDRLLNSIPVGIVTIDEAEYVQNVNATALSLLGLSHAPSMRLKYYELLPDLKGILGAWKQMSEIQRLRYVFRHGDGAEAQFSFNLVPIRNLPGEASTGASYIMVFENISKLLELEKKLEFESRLAATGELAAGIAHEIRNPLASISGSIELLSRNLHLDNEQDQRLFDIALREVHRLNMLITDFLEFAKPRDETAGDFNLAATVREVADALETSAIGGGNIKFVENVSPKISIHANRERIKQVLFNLFLNSFEASGDNGVTITISATESRDGHALLDVYDNGPGITAEHAAKIFDPFFTTKSHGTGLGLATVARILKAAKSDIALLPAPKGAHFQLTIPTSSTMELAGTAS
jgi:two-component system sensor histidine kinase PilS (NtrC family)